MVNISFKGGSFHNKSRVGVIIFTGGAPSGKSDAAAGCECVHARFIILLLNRVCWLLSVVYGRPCFSFFPFRVRKNNDKSCG
jgi:hypothetical protein